VSYLTHLRVKWSSTRFSRLVVCVTPRRWAHLF